MKVVLKYPLFVFFILWSIRNLFFYFPFYSEFQSKIIFDPKYIKKGMETIYGAYDFSHFFTVAKTFYNPNSSFFKTTGINPVSVVIVKFPLYPILSLFFSKLFNIRLDISFVLFNNLVSLILIFLIYKYLQYLKFSPHVAFFTAIVSLFFPARWVMYQLIPSADMLAALLFIGFLISYKKSKKYSLVFLTLFISSRPNAFIVLFPLIFDLITHFYKYFYNKKFDKNKFILNLLNIFTGTIVFSLICLIYYQNFQNPLIFLSSKLDQHYTFFVKEFIPQILFYGLGSDNLTWNFFFLLLGTVFLFHKKEYFIAISSSFFILPLFFYTNDIQRYSFIIYPLLLFPVIGLLISSLKVLERINYLKLAVISIFLIIIVFISAKYFWYTVSSPGYQDPLYPIIKNIYF